MTTTSIGIAMVRDRWLECGFLDGTSAKDHHVRLDPHHSSQVEPIPWPEQKVYYALVSQLVDWFQFIACSLLKQMEASIGNYYQLVLIFDGLASRKTEL